MELVQPSVATVNASGSVTSVAPDIAVITARGWWGGTRSGYILVRHPSQDAPLVRTAAAGLPRAAADAF